MFQDVFQSSWGWIEWIVLRTSSGVHPLESDPKKSCEDVIKICKSDVFYLSRWKDVFWRCLECLGNWSIRQSKDA